jgi:hypothetical protein
LRPLAVDAVKVRPRARRRHSRKGCRRSRSPNRFVSQRGGRSPNTHGSAPAGGATNHSDACPPSATRADESDRLPRDYSHQMAPDVDPNAYDVILLRQQWTPIINRYVFSLPDAQGNEGERFAFVEQKRFTFKEEIRFYTDAKRVEVLRIKARQRFDLPRVTTSPVPLGRRSAKSRRSSERVSCVRAIGSSTRTVTRLAKRPNAAWGLPWVVARSGSFPTSGTTRTGCRSRTTSSSPEATKFLFITPAGAGSSPTRTRWTADRTRGAPSIDVSFWRRPWEWTPCRRGDLGRTGRHALN